jgi:hypothetical protein
MDRGGRVGPRAHAREKRGGEQSDGGTRALEGSARSGREIGEADVWG